jgi:hypothetical protein
MLTGRKRYYKNGSKCLIVNWMSRPRNHSLTYREKNCRRGCLWARQHNLEMFKGFAAKVYTTFFEQPKICNYVHIMNK